MSKRTERMSRSAAERINRKDTAVSYTHLDVYKRQASISGFGYRISRYL